MHDLYQIRHNYIKIICYGAMKFIANSKNTAKFFLLQSQQRTHFVVQFMCLHHVPYEVEHTKANTPSKINTPKPFTY